MDSALWGHCTRRRRAHLRTIEAFALGQDLDWCEQVTVLATPPGHRHVAASAAAVLNTTRATGFDAPPTGARRVVSADADAADRDRPG